MEKDILLLFDMDDTLTVPRVTIQEDLEQLLYEKVKPFAQLGLVTGADLEKIFE